MLTLTLTSNSILQNYCIWDGLSLIVLCPLGKAIMMNHQPIPYANVEMRWFSWLREHNDLHSRDKVLTMTNITELIHSPIAPLDVMILNQVMNIFNYGYEWENNWELFQQEIINCNNNKSDNNKDDDDDSIHQCKTIGDFRSYISVGYDTFPSAWKGEIDGNIPSLSSTEIVHVKLILLIQD